jgi:hypothetical protein
MATGRLERSGEMFSSSDRVTYLDLDLDLNFAFSFLSFICKHFRPDVNLIFLQNIDRGLDLPTLLRP